MKQRRCDISGFATRLRSLRNERGYSMDKFCELYNAKTNQNLHKGTVSRWEAGTQEPMLSTVSSLAEFLNVSPAYLLGETDDRSCNASNINNSVVLQNSNAETLIALNGSVAKQATELLRIFETLDVRRQTKLLMTAFELESEIENENK